MDKISLLKKEVTEYIDKELEYISGFFNYDLRQFFNRELIYFNAVFIFFKEFSQAGPDTGKLKYNGRLKAFINLIVGMELLSVGLNIHSFDIDGLKRSKSFQKNPNLKERTYTIELLFGDIFYSRAVIYLLGFGDHIVFDEILTSLKTVHKSRLALHHCVLDEPEDGLIGNIKKQPPFFYGIGELFKTSFLIGMVNALPEADFNKMGVYYNYISLIVVLKIYSDIEKLFSHIYPNTKKGKEVSFFYNAKAKIKLSIDDTIGKIEEPFLKSNLRHMSEIFT